MFFSAARTLCRALVLAAVAFAASAVPPLATTAAAQAPVITPGFVGGNFYSGSPPGFFGRDLQINVSVTSANPVSSVIATYAGRTTALQPSLGGWLAWDMATVDLPFGPTLIEIRATDTLGNSVAVQVTRTHDNPPTVEILAPAPDVLARPNVRVHARCADDGGPCQLTVASVTGVSGTNEIDRTVSLAELQRSSGQDQLFVRATDSLGQEGLASRRIWVEQSQRLSLVASYPGLIQDLDTTRAVVFTDGSPRQVVVVDRLTGAAQAIFSEPPQRQIEDAQLTPSGVLFSVTENNIVSQLYEWTPNALVPLGRVIDLEQFVGKMRVEGSWALFSRERQSQFNTSIYDLVRRDLISGAEVVLVNGSINPTMNSDLAANGDAVFVRANSGYELVRYRQGAFEVLFAGALNPMYVRTDGTVVIYETRVGQAQQCRVDTPNGVVVLADDPTSFNHDLQAREGWAACRKTFAPQPAIWTRSPSGARLPVYAPSSATIDAVGGDGNLLYSVPENSTYGMHRYMVRGDLRAVEIGSGKWRVQREDGIWYVIAGPHLFRVLGPESLLSEGASGPFFDLDVAILNPTSEQASVFTQFLMEGGEPVGRHRYLPAHTRLTIRVDEDEPEVASAAASTYVTSPTPLVVERTMTWDASGYGGHSGAAVDGPRRRWLFAEGAQGFFDTFILLVNNEVGPATVQLKFFVELGDTVTRQITVGGRTRVTIHTGAIPELVNRSFATVVEASAPIAAERAMYFGSAPMWTGGHGSAGVSQASTRWFHAEGSTGTVFDTFILLANPNAATASAVVRFLTEGGATVTLPVTLAPLSRRTINPETVDPLLANASFATAVQSDLPIVSERAMYWTTVGGSWQEAHNSFGVTTTGTKWATADGRSGGARGYQTYVLVANTSTSATATLVATFMRSDGAQFTRTLDLGPSRRLNIDCGTIPELANSEFGVVIESTNGVPIVVERATYWNAGGILWAGGTNVTATPVP